MNTTEIVIECEECLLKINSVIKLEENRTKNYFKLPIITLGLTSLQVIVFLYIQNIDNELGNKLCYLRNHKKEFWRLITYILVHISVSHLLTNITVQCLFGSLLEIEQGKLRTCIIIIFGGISGIFGTEFFSPNYNSIAGSSASCYALLAAYIPHLLMNHDHLKVVKYRCLIITWICLSEILSLFPSVQNLLSRYICESLMPTGSKYVVCKVSHLAGAFVGFLMSLIIFYFKKPTNKSCSYKTFKMVRHLSNTILSLSAGITIYSYCTIIFTP